MELKTVRKEMTAGDLKGLIDLPNYADDQRVSIIVSPVEPVAEKEDDLSAKELKEIVKSLVGAIPYTEKSADELRMERLVKKYEIAG